MKNRRIYITQTDYEKLGEYLAGVSKGGRGDQEALMALEDELVKCQVVESREIPPDVVTMNSRVRFRDLATNEEMTVTLVFPGGRISDGCISVISPIGTALLGYAEGDVIEWIVPSGKKTIRIEKVLYQPEAAGEHHP